MGLLRRSTSPRGCAITCAMRARMKTFFVCASICASKIKLLHSELREGAAVQAKIKRISVARVFEIIEKRCTSLEKNRKRCASLQKVLKALRECKKFLKLLREPSRTKIIAAGYMRHGRICGFRCMGEHLRILFLACAKSQRARENYHTSNQKD